ncbi:Os05g0166525 [Oryza sativa Japonica Group]|uniref:Os05g0166525 protein n=1 Tax=Oryza sativa subsp. japonica TaxID=39947 RepID=A0A0P0WIA3_ORYSJ|nr:Os05g0166525 [Oryza sativa Japonica Group]
MTLVVFMVVTVVVLATVALDQIMEALLEMTRSPSFDSSSRVWLSWRSVTGLSLFATQTVVNAEMLLNHMPTYQLGEVMLPELVTKLGWKKPSVNLPFLDTSLSLTASDSPAVRVSFTAAEHGGAPCREKRRRPRNM